MIKFLQRLLGIELFEKNFEELSQDDTKLSERIRKLDRDMKDLLVYLKVERRESWKEDKNNPLNPPKLISSKWVKNK